MSTPRRGRRSGPPALLLAAAARAALTTIGGLLLWALAPAALGWPSTVVVTASMAPRLNPGDVVVARPVDPNRLRLGQVLLVDDPDHAGRLRLHRLVAFRGDGTLTLRGDANRTDDSTPVARTAVRGVGALHVPYIGRPLLWLREHDTLSLAGTAAALAVLVALAGLYRPGRPRPEPCHRGQAQPRARGRSHHGIHRRPSRPAPRSVPRTAALVLVVGAALTAHFALPGHARAGSRFTGAAGAPTSGWSAARYFTCANAVLATPSAVWLYYPFTGTSGGKAQDLSPNNHTGNFRGGVTLNVTPDSCARDTATAVRLDGSTGYISTNDQANNPTVFTIEIRFRTTTTRGGELVGFGDTITSLVTGEDRNLYLTNAGRVAFGVGGGGLLGLGSPTVVTSPGSYNDGAWHLADATLSAAGMQLYVDGTRVAADPSVTTANNYKGYWRIGYGNVGGLLGDPTSQYVAATVDQVAIYTAALGADDIAAHYDAAG